MRAFAAVFAREVAERRMVFLVGLGSGLLFLVGAAAHGWNAPGGAEVRLLAGSVGGVALGAALGLLYGASVIAGETAEKRISFYFSRPVPAAAIWAGKLLAAIFLSFSAGILVFLPGWLTGPAHARGIWGFEIDPGPALLLAAAAVVLAVLAAHAVVTVARLRSPWAILDLVLGIVFAFVLVLLLRTLIRDGILTGPVLRRDSRPALLMTAAVAVVVGLALLVATLVQVGAGRTDARRAHGAFSTTLWGILGAVLSVLALSVGWMASGGAQNITRVGDVRAAPRGAWIEAGGSLSAGRGGGNFLFNPASGRSLRIHGSIVDFSRDGTHALWSEERIEFFEGRGTTSDLWIAQLSTGRPMAMRLEDETGWQSATLSPSGRRVVAWAERALATYDVSNPANPKQLAAFALPADGRAFDFVDEDTIRVFPRIFNASRRSDLAPTALEITELSLPSKKSLATGRFDRQALPWLRMSADGRFFIGTKRLAEDPKTPQALTLHDGRTGALLGTLAEDLSNPQVRFLSGNRLAVVGIADAKARALFFEGEKGWGAPVRIVELGPARRVVLGGEMDPGRVAVSLFPFEENPPSASPRSAKLILVDAATGTVSTRGEGLVPANRLGWWIERVMPPAEAGAPWTSLFLDADGRLVRLDPATGARTIILGKR